MTKNFARALFDLHGCRLPKICTGKTRFSRALFRDFSCFYTGTFFLHGQKLKILHGYTLVLHAQKKNTGMRVFAGSSAALMCLKMVVCVNGHNQCIEFKLVVNDNSQ